jgi:protein-serine/threonine kinase
MMTWSANRLTVEGIRSHPFFYGVNWDTLRFIDPPMVPHLKSITDTSYFPTEELEDVSEDLQPVEGVGAEKDLAFLG